MSSDWSPHPMFKISAALTLTSVDQEISLLLHGIVYNAILGYCNFKVWCLNVEIKLAGTGEKSELGYKSAANKR